MFSYYNLFFSRKRKEHHDMIKRPLSWSYCFLAIEKRALSNQSDYFWGTILSNVCVMWLTVESIMLVRQ